MKTIQISIMAAAAAVLTGCSGVSDSTKISGNVSGGQLTEVNVIVKDMAIDTLVPVKDGRFELTLPSNAAAIGQVMAGQYRTSFIPDGTALEITLSADSKVVSKSPAKSVQEKFNRYQEQSASIQDDFRTNVNAITGDESLSEEQRKEKLEENYEKTIGGFMDFNDRVFAENTDNVLSVIALQQIAVLSGDDAKADSLIALLSPALQETPAVKDMKAEINTRLETAEGRMFKDFTVGDSDGKTVKFSDYVGKGRYVLVDFWASWCGPCKAEIPNVKNVYNKYHRKGLDVLSVAVWDEPQATKDTAKAYGVNWKQIINAQRVPADLYGIQGIPHIILFGPDGTILKRGLRGEEIETEISKYIK